MSDPNLRDRCIEAAARPFHAMWWPNHDWDSQGDKIRDHCRATVAASVDAVLLEVAAHAEAKQAETVDRHGNFFGPWFGMNHDLNQGASDALDWLANECLLRTGEASS